MDFTARRERRSTENVVPLINVVFLLLIFFMLAGSLRRVEPFAVELPRASARALEARASEPVLFVGADGELAFDGEPLDLAALVTKLGSRPGPDALQLRADARVPAKRLLPLLDRLRSAGLVELELVVSDAR